MAIEQRIARETEAERLDDFAIEARLENLKTAITTDIEAATDINTQQEYCYEVALWELLADGYASDRRRQAMQKAPDKLDEQLEKLAEKESGEEQ